MAFEIMHRPPIYSLSLAPSIGRLIGREKNINKFQHYFFTFEM